MDEVEAQAMKARNDLVSPFSYARGLESFHIARSFLDGVYECLRRTKSITGFSAMYIHSTLDIWLSDRIDLSSYLTLSSAVPLTETCTFYLKGYRQ